MGRIFRTSFKVSEPNIHEGPEYEKSQHYNAAIVQREVLLTLHGTITLVLTSSSNATSSLFLNQIITNLERTAKQ